MQNNYAMDYATIYAMLALASAARALGRRAPLELCGP